MGAFFSPDRTAFVHIGTHKTGTTSIQELLAKNARRLRHHGLLIPTAGRSEPNSGHHNIAWELACDARFDPRLGTLETVLAELAATPARTPDACISSEDFELLHGNAAALRRLRDGLEQIGFTPRIIMYVRPQADYIESAYAEAVKAHDVAFDDFFEAILAGGAFGPQLFCYDRLADELSAVFGRQNMLVRAYDAALPSPALHQEFVGIVARGASVRHLRLPARLNAMAAFSEVIAARDNRLGRSTRHEIPSRQRFDPLTSTDIQRIHQRFAASNERLAATYGTQITAATAAIVAREASADARGDRESRGRKALLRSFPKAPNVAASQAAFGGTWEGGRARIAQPI